MKVKCGYCGGTGRVDSGDIYVGYVNCSSCAGRGYFEGEPTEKAPASRLWLARQSSTGDLFVLRAGGEDEAYRLFAREVLKLDTSGDFDVGNVDVDLFDLPPAMSPGEVRRLEGETP